MGIKHLAKECLEKNVEYEDEVGVFSWIKDTLIWFYENCNSSFSLIKSLLIYMLKSSFIFERVEYSEMLEIGYFSWEKFKSWEVSWESKVLT